MMMTVLGACSMSKPKSAAEPLKWYEKKSRKHFSTNNDSSSTTEPDTKQAASLHQQKPLRKPQSSAHTNPTVPYVQHTYAHKPNALPLTRCGTLFLQTSVPRDAQEIISSFDKIVSSSHPLSSKQRVLLPQQIRELSHNLTDERSGRRLGYMNQTTTLSAYIYYYEWWNLIRLTRLFSNLDTKSFGLNDDDICVDIGSGPLTVPIALFLSRPELRAKKLTWYCMDLSPTSLAAGEEILLTISARLKCEPWKIIRVKGELGTPLKEKASLVTCANVFNEIVDDFSMPPDYLAKKNCEKILSYAKDDTSSVLIIEPGVPKAARFISLLRDALIRREFMPVAPCPHCGECPMDGKRGGKWCNFAFSTDAAPAALKKLSEASDLPKERAVLSFIFAVKAPIEKPEEFLFFRVTSDPIKLPGGRTGYYACSDKGLLLVVAQTYLASGDLYKIKRPSSLEHIDAKSGALVVEAQ